MYLSTEWVGLTRKYLAGGRVVLTQLGPKICPATIFYAAKGSKILVPKAHYPKLHSDNRSRLRSVRCCGHSFMPASQNQLFKSIVANRQPVQTRLRHLVMLSSVGLRQQRRVGHIIEFIVINCEISR